MAVLPAAGVAPKGIAVGALPLWLDARPNGIAVTE